MTKTFYRVRTWGTSEKAPNGLHLDRVITRLLDTGHKPAEIRVEIATEEEPAPAGKKRARVAEIDGAAHQERNQPTCTDEDARYSSVTRRKRPSAP